MSGVQTVYALYNFPRFGGRSEMINDVNAPYDQNAVFRLDLPANIRRQMFIACVYFARLQRAPEGSDESTTGGGHDVIERRRVGFGDFRPHAVVLGNRPMHTEAHRLTFGRQIRQTRRANLALDSHIGNIRYLRHL